MKNIDKQIVRGELERIRQAHDGVLLPADIVEAATPPDNPLHCYFEWDDAIAGHQHRLAQAYTLRSQIELQWRSVEKEQREIERIWKPSLRQYTPQPNGEPGSVPTLEIIREQPEPVLIMEWKRTNALVNRMREYLMMAGLDEAAELIQSAMESVYATITKASATQAKTASASPGAARRESARQGVAGKRRRSKSPTATP